MANIKSAEKRSRQTITRTQRNRAAKTRVKNSRRDVLAAIEAGDRKPLAEKLGIMASAADKAANRGVIHRNKASRLKSRAARAAATVAAK